MCENFLMFAANWRGANGHLNLAWIFNTLLMFLFFYNLLKEIFMKYPGGPV